MIILLILVIMMALTYWYTYPKLGHYLYFYGNTIEAKLYGFAQKNINIDGISHSVWSNNNSTKPMLLLVHGFSASHAVWLRYAKHFTNDYHVVIPDLAGHGKTGYSEQQDYTIDAQAKRLIQLIHQMGSENAHIVGNSMGGYIAAHMATYYPEMCLSMGLIDPAGLNSPTPSKMGLLISEGSNPFLINNDAEFSRFYSMTMARPPYIPTVVKSALSQQYQARREELVKIFEDFNRQHNYLATELNKVKCPCLLIWGAKDELIDVSCVEVWAGLLNCEQHVWHDLGHMPMLEAPERTACATAEFLNRQKN